MSLKVDWFVVDNRMKQEVNHQNNILMQKKQIIVVFGLLLLCSVLVLQNAHASNNENPGKAKISYTQIILSASSKDKQVLFGVEEIKKAAEERGLKVPDNKINKKDLSGLISVNVISDSSQILSAIKEKGLQTPKYIGWQCYSLRVIKTGNNSDIWVLSSDKTGAMYGCLDIAEAIRNQTAGELTDADNKPYLERRGIKFNIPLDLRTPSYSDLSDAFQQNIPVMWDMEFWKQQFDEMARCRYNVISYWSLNPFPSLVKVPEFPKIALNDVWRTTAKINANYSTSGSGNLNADLLKNYEVIKKISISEKINFWRKVMEYARDRGIEVYLFNWNIFTFGENGRYGITSSRSNDTTIAYFRASVREMVLTYPLLAGIGITAGENMGGKNEKYTNEQWLWKTYGEGIRDALKKQPDRKIRLIHRFHMTGLTEIYNEFKDYPGIMDLSIKYSIAHMLSIPNPPFAKGAFEILPVKQRTWLTVRNDDVYSYRWGNPAYARQYLLEIPGPEKVAGYYMGPDGYCWGKDFLGKDNIQPGQLIIQKQWYSFMLWGRLSYNPGLPDELFRQTIATRFPDVSARSLMNAWSAASMVFPWITRLSWGDIDLKWFPEACISNPSYKGFYTVKDFMEVDPMPGSNIQNITEWAQNYKFNKTDVLLPPTAAADSISKYSRIATIYLQELTQKKQGTSGELNQTLGDIEAFATIGFYYSEKILGACSLALFNFYGLPQDKEDAIAHLTKAKSFWIKYSVLYDSKYKPAIFNRIGYVNIPSLIKKTDQDILIAGNWKMGDIKEYKRKTNTEVPFKK
jgi:hypothetical protein